MIVMTSRPELRPLLVLLLTTSSLVSSRRLLSVGEDLQKTATSTQQHGVMTTPKSSSETPPLRALSPTMAWKKEAQHTLEMVTTQHSKRSETSRPSTGNESLDSEHLSPGREGVSTLSVTNVTSASTSTPRTYAMTALASLKSTKLAPIQITASAVTVSIRSESSTKRQSPQQMTTVQPVTKKNATRVHSTQTETRHVCSTASPKRDGLVGRCLLAIALLAALATIFIVSTIILVTKLAARKYRNQPELLEEMDTEMVCISRAVSGGDTERPVPKPRRPRSNGALIVNTEDEDGDDLTLNSFLPDTECAA
ncbi:P-selectin glycoprotein ligand 1 [Brachyhypopomus gauderio]|uniref:P-selectin glycoprotein ligand 1 n=1 Tax=Brachyhypopomus gauderio TaxID=698409 RepID=UPI004040FC0F